MSIIAWLEKMRSAPLADRKKWLVVSAILCMAAVVYVWLAYFNSIVGVADNSAVRIAESEENFSLWQSLKGVAGVIGGRVMGRASAVGALFGGSRDFLISP